MALSKLYEQKTVSHGSLGFGLATEMEPLFPGPSVNAKLGLLTSQLPPVLLPWDSFLRISPPHHHFFNNLVTMVPNPGTVLGYF